MEDNKIIKIAATGFVVLFVAPAVLGLAATAIGAVANGVNTIAYKRKIKKGMKEGKIVEIQGNYYEVVEEPEEN